MTKTTTKKTTESVAQSDKVETILHKLARARKIIRSRPLKKNAHNDYSKFDYFTPEYVENLVESACEEVGLITLCSLEADEYGLYQYMLVLDIDNRDHSLSFKLRTARNEGMTATGPAQQMGATDTYSERYIKMKVFGIKENSLDPDATSGKPEAPAKKPDTPAKKPVSPVLAQKKQVMALLKVLGLTVNKETIGAAIRIKTGVELSDENLPEIISRLKVLVDEKV